MASFLRALKRGGRAIVAILLAGIPAYFDKDPKYLLFAPLIQAIGKWLRDKLGLKYVPF